MGAGPERLMECGLIDRLEQAGHEVVPCTIRLPPHAFMPEVQAAFELDRRLSGCVGEAIAAGAFPLILSGHWPGGFCGERRRAWDRLDAGINL